jgi:hypothetical protein
MSWPRRTDGCASGSARWKAGKRAARTDGENSPRGGPGTDSPLSPFRPSLHPAPVVRQLIRRHGVRRQLGSGVRHSGGWPRRRPEAAITRDEAQAWFTRFLLRRVGRDEYPSTTQLDLIEKSIPRELLDDYLRTLVDKVAHDRFPSVPLLRRIQRLIECLPHTGHPHRPRRAGRDDPEQDTEQDVPTVSSETASDE